MNLIPNELKTESHQKPGRINYKKMLKDINAMVDNDWAFDVTDCKVKEAKKGKITKWDKFTQEEAQQMSEVLGDIYKIAHGIDCVCGNKYTK